MLTLFGKRQSYCDGLTRRNFLKIGAMGFGGLTLPGLLRGEAAAAQGNLQAPASQKSIINVYLSGGPSHIDTFDLKPSAPPEIRGEFHPIATTVPGMEICHLMPKLAGLGKKIAIVRSLTDIRDEHAPNQTESGWSQSELKSLGGHPSLGCVVSKLRGPTTEKSVPTFVDLSGHSVTGFLGPVYSGFRPNSEGRGDLQLQQIGLDRFHSRTELLGRLDRIRRDVDSTHAMDAMDAFNQRAVGLITSNKMADALNWEKADTKVRERYGINTDQSLSTFLVAKRLIETGVRIISMSWGGWDTHAQNFTSLRRQLPPLDTALSAMIEDLDASGLLGSTMIVMWGEFGRTPRINPGAGRDHWARAASALVAGGGMRMGQVIGSTNRYGETAQDRPVHLQEMFATFYHLLGIDPQTTTIRDPNGRPQYLVTHPDPIAELIG
ncbi:MAG TPA: DUF1501 domain-containing protein [Pirellulales bacterium]|jgi:hypothetical protein|nr:DUF1501 domain-containing protein [Pirellulales bacterium]